MNGVESGIHDVLDRLGEHGRAQIERFERDWTARGIPDDREARLYLGAALARLADGGASLDLICEYARACADFAARLFGGPRAVP